MVHAAIHWPSDGADEIRLWAFAIEHAAWLYNRLPNPKTGLTPLELFTKSKSDHRDLLRSHVWGCPVYVLDPSLADGKKIPKWNRRARLGQFLGFSDEHSSLVGKVRNLKTGYVSPQYHLVYDDLFQTVYNGTTLADTAADAIFDDLFENERDWYGEIVTNSAGEVIYQPPPLEDIWLDETERREKKVEVRRRRELAREREREQDEAFDPEPIPIREFIPASKDDDSPPDMRMVSDDEDSSVGSRDEYDSDDDVFPSSTPTDAPPPAPNIAPPPPPIRQSEGATLPEEAPPLRRSRRLRREYNRNTRGLQDGIRDGQYYASKERFCVSRGPKQPPPAFIRYRSRKRKQYAARLERRKLEHTAFTLGALDWEVPSVEALLRSSIAKFITFAATEVGYSGTVENLVCEWIHPMMLQAKAAASKEDNPNWWQAMNGPFSEEYWKAACVEEEGDAAGFLGVKLERDADGRRLRMTQCGLIDRVISALDLDDPSTKLKATPADRKPLVKDADGPPSDVAFSYASVVGMLLYLAGHSRPDIAYAVNCCARYTFCPKRSHVAALKRIGRYLKSTRDNGLILDPTEDLNIEAFPNADFAGLYGYKESTDPTCTWSRTGFVINVANCPVFWQSKLQSETALSTMEAEVVAFCACCRELIPILDI
ncbi:hypothetical protein ACHAXS_001818, partial [Conticribra weissflogii]